MSDPLLGAGRLRALLDAHGVRPHKRLGQNFVVDPNTVRKVVEHARVRSDGRVLEVGAGGGSLTIALARAAASVVAIELDPALLGVLREVLAGVSNVEVFHGDAMRVDLGSYDAGQLVANLPYNIAAAVVIKVLEQAPDIADLTVMTQREVGQRLAAAPGSGTYGVSSVIVSYFARAELVMRVSRNAFYPVPQVDSALVRIVRHREPADVDRQLLLRVVRAAFSQRRKTLRRSLAAAAGSSRDAERALIRAELDPEARAERLSVDDFIAVTRALAPGRRSSARRDRARSAGQDSL
jgi:16S rRNA (adenine1518-N6/adenine1519-N6)-dimethyltransferase